MRWEDERYVRVYTRDTVSWVGLGWEAQALFIFVLRKVDRAGILDLGKSGMRGLASLVRMPEDIVARNLPILLEDGCIEQSGTSLVVPNFIEAQETSMSPTARQKEYRERSRDLIRSGLDPKKRQTVIYFIQSEHGGQIKIGHAEDLAKRLQGLSTSRPDKLVVLASFPATIGDERRLHEALSDDREKGEWFSCSQRVMSAAKAAAKDGATIEGVLGHIESVTCHETSTVTPYLTVPNCSVPSCTVLSKEKEYVADPPPDSVSKSSLEPKNNQKKKVELAVSPSLEVIEVFEHWKARLKKRVALLTKARADVVQRQLDIGRTVADCKLAIDGCAATPWNQGQNPNSKRYDDITLIFRDAEHMEGFIDTAERPPSRDPPRGDSGQVIPINPKPRKLGFVENEL